MGVDVVLFGWTEEVEEMFFGTPGIWGKGRGGVSGGGEVAQINLASTSCIVTKSLLAQHQHQHQRPCLSLNPATKQLRGDTNPIRWAKLS